MAVDPFLSFAPAAVALPEQPEMAEMALSALFSDTGANSSGPSQAAGFRPDLRAHLPRRYRPGASRAADH